MRTYPFIAVLLVFLMAGRPGSGQAQSKEPLGKVDFKNSCNPAVQGKFQQAVAMLHSFGGGAEKTFRDVLAEDPTCVIATWGIAAILMSNPFAGIGPSPAARAQAAIDQGRQIGARTERERDYIDAVAAYYEDWATHFARALGAARSGDPASAAKAVEALVRLRDALKAGMNEYWATEVEVSRLGAAAWTAWALGNGEEALGLMRSAADIEDKNEKHIVTPGRIAPARELLGELLLALKRPADALKEFEASQVREPDRFRGVFGAAQAVAQSGDRATAKRYFARLMEIAGHGTARPDLVQARAFLDANP